jgi:hypothetical protein
MVLAANSGQVREREKDVSAEQAKAQEDPRLLGAHEHTRGAGGSEAQAPQGPQAFVCVAGWIDPEGG